MAKKFNIGRLHSQFCVLGLLLLGAWLTGCEEEITLDLPNADERRVVIEAYLWDNHGDGIPFTARVLVSRSQDVFATTLPRFIDNALVVIFDDAGQRDTLDYMMIDSLLEDIPSLGAYVSPNIAVVPGRTYTCEVSVDGQTYRSVSLCPLPIHLDSLSTYFRKEEAFFEEGYYVKLHGQDPVGIGQNYLIRHYVNDTLKRAPSEISIIEDEFVDGNYIDGELFATFKPNDTVRVEFHTITAALYEYWFAFQQVADGMGGPFSGPGANPPTMFNNRALGQFWVSSPQFLAIRIPE